MPTKKQLESELADLRNELDDARGIITTQEREIEVVDNINADLSNRYGRALETIEEERQRRFDIAEQYARLSDDVAALAEETTEVLESTRAEIEGLSNHNDYLVSVLGSISLYRGPNPATPATLAYAAVEEALPEIMPLEDALAAHGVGDDQ